MQHFQSRGSITERCTDSDEKQVTDINFFTYRTLQNLLFIKSIEKWCLMLKKDVSLNTVAKVKVNKTNNPNQK